MNQIPNGINAYKEVRRFIIELMTSEVNLLETIIGFFIATHTEG